MNDIDNIMDTLRDKGYIVVTNDNKDIINLLIDSFDFAPDDIKNIILETELDDEMVNNFLNGRSFQDLTEQERFYLLKNFHVGCIGDDNKRKKAEREKLSSQEGVYLFGQKRVWDAKQSKFITVNL